MVTQKKKTKEYNSKEEKSRIQFLKKKEEEKYI